MDRATTDWAIPRDEAVPRLVELHGNRLYGLAKQICGNVEEAEDLVQDVFLQAWRKWDQFDGRSTPFVWLYTIARHACQRMHRKRSGEPEHIESLDELLPFGAKRVAFVPDDDDELDVHVRRERREVVGAAIASLPADFRMPLVLKDIIGFAVADVAAILGLNPSTVKTRLHRARLKVRSALESGLPQKELPPAAYSRQVCLDLLHAKQESLDRGVPMQGVDEILCERCETVFATLDLTKDLCAELANAELPPRLRQVLLERRR